MSRPSVPDEVLAATLRELRAERGITRETLAFRSGITPAALARIELAQAAPGWNTVRQVAMALEVGMVELCVAVEGKRSSATVES